MLAKEMTSSIDRRALRAAAEQAVLKLARGEEMRTAIAQLTAGRIGVAERVARSRLQRHPHDVAALCLLGDLAGRAGVHSEAERLFRLALDRAPFFTDAQINLAKVLALRDGLPESIAILGEIATDLPDRWDIALRRLTLLAQIGEYEEAANAFTPVLARHGDRADVWLAYAHLQNTRGHLADSVSAFRRAIELDPAKTEAWWGLANLKTFMFSSEDVAQMIRELRSVLPENAPPLQFALGKAFEDRGEVESSFKYYDAGNQAMRNRAPFSAAKLDDEIERSIAFFSTTQFARRSGVGNPSNSPIFIVGLPRSGSTLIEQILSSHSMVEGTSELPYIPMLVHRLLSERWSERTLTFPEVLRNLPDERLAALGSDYLAAAAIHRRSGAPYFIDKLPNNWSYIGFIRLILPNAKIIDARRSPMACCWSNYRQWFARGQEFSYDLGDLGRYYRAYVRFLDHIEGALPNRVYRVTHEAMLSDPAGEIERLLAAIRLPFEEACLRFYENDRPVRTASAQQVRQPIQPGAGVQWQKYASWLEPLRAELDDLV